MNQITIFIQQYGWQLAIIAVVGIILLGVLKYANAFSKIEKEKRKPIYFAISIGFSIVATVIYLAVQHQLTVENVAAVAAAIYALNQTFYSIYETTTLRDITNKIVTWIKEYLTKKGSE